MSEQIDQFVEKLRVQLNTVEQNLAKAGETAKAAPEQAANAMQNKIDAAKSQLAVIKQEADAKSALTCLSTP